LWRFRHGLAFLVVLVVIFEVLGCCLRVSAVNDAEADAKTAITEAEGTVLICYGAAEEAERAGANISDLQGVLNEAGWLLSRAELAYEMEDFGLAVSFADQSKARLDGFVADAEVLRKTAMHAGYWDFMANVMGSSVGAVAIFFGGFAVWTFLKKREKEKERV